MGYVISMGASHCKMAFVLPDFIEQKIGPIQDKWIYGLSCSEELSERAYHLIQLYSRDTLHCLLVKATISGSEAGGMKISVLKHVHFPDEYTFEELIPWKNGSFLATMKTPKGEEEIENGAAPGSYNAHLCRVDIKDFLSDNPFVCSKIGLEGFGASSFCVDTYGDTIYWPVVHEGDPELVVDEKTGETSLTGITHDYYAIMASDFYSSTGYLDDAEGSFSDPYVFAEVNHRMDSLFLARRSQKSYDRSELRNSDVVFLSTSLTDREKLKADLYYTSMPSTRCLTVTSIYADALQIYPGQTLNVCFEVRNDGNEWIRTCVVDICNRDGSVIKSAQVIFDKDSLVESIWNPRQEDGTLEGAEKYDYWLAPGRSAVYRTDFTIPKDWDGEREIVVRINTMQLKENVRKVPAFEIDTQADEMTALADATVTREAPIDYISILKEEPYDRLSCGIEDYQMDYQDLNPAPIRIRAAKTGSDTKAGASTGTGAGTNTASGTGSRSAVPSTGDPSDAPSRLGLIAGAAGAGILAYSKRCTKLEDDGKQS